MGEHWTWQGPFIPPGEPFEGETYRADGWAYVDPPGRFSPDGWKQFLAIIGDGEYRILAMSEGIHPSDGKPFARGQLLVSPQGWQNMTAARKTQ